MVRLLTSHLLHPVLLFLIIIISYFIQKVCGKIPSIITFYPDIKQGEKSPKLFTHIITHYIFLVFLHISIKFMIARIELFYINP